MKIGKSHTLKGCLMVKKIPKRSMWADLNKQLVKSASITGVHSYGSITTKVQVQVPTGVLTLIFLSEMPSVNFFWTVLKHKS